MTTIAIAYHSGYGHTARQASAVRAGIESVASARATSHDVSVLGRRVAELAVRLTEVRADVTLAR